jgi:hypothetical protein
VTGRQSFSARLPPVASAAESCSASVHRSTHRPLPSSRPICLGVGPWLPKPCIGFPPYASGPPASPQTTHTHTHTQTHTQLLTPPTRSPAPAPACSVGQEDIDEVISRDIHRTFPEYPLFAFEQVGRQPGPLCAHAASWIPAWEEAARTAGQRGWPGLLTHMQCLGGAAGVPRFGNRLAPPQRRSQATTLCAHIHLSSAPAPCRASSRCLTCSRRTLCTTWRCDGSVAQRGAAQRGAAWEHSAARAPAQLQRGGCSRGLGGPAWDRHTCCCDSPVWPLPFLLNEASPPPSHRHHPSAHPADCCRPPTARAWRLWRACCCSTPRRSQPSSSSAACSGGWGTGVRE